MIVFTFFLLLVFTGFLLYRFKETVVVISAFIGVLQMVMIHKNVSLFDALAIISFLCFVTQNICLRTIRFYPFVWGSLAVVVSMVCTNVFAPSEAHWPITIISIVSNLLFPFVLWYCLRSGKMSLRKLFVSCMLGLLLAVSLYGLYELVSNSNPIIEYAVKHKDNFANNIGLSNRYRFGIRRIQSFLTYNAALGITANLGIIFLAYLYKKNMYRKSFLQVMLVLMVMMSLFTGTRSVVVGLVVALCYYIFSRNIKFSYVLSVGIVGVALVLICQEYLGSIFISFTDSQSVNGSNADMRETQFSTAYYFMSKTGIFGNGVGFLSTYVKEYYTEDILGAESVWLPLMINNGYVGVVAYALFFILPFIYCIKHNVRIGLAVILSFILTKTLTSAPGVSHYYFLIYLVFYVTEKNDKWNMYYRNYIMALSQIRQKLFSMKG